MHPIYCDMYFVLPSAFDILRYILSCRAIAIYDLPINLRYIYKRVSPLMATHHSGTVESAPPGGWTCCSGGRTHPPGGHTHRPRKVGGPTGINNPTYNSSTCPIERAGYKGQAKQKDKQKQFNRQAKQKFRTSSLLLTLL